MCTFPFLLLGFQRFGTGKNIAILVILCQKAGVGGLRQRKQVRKLETAGGCFWDLLGGSRGKFQENHGKIAGKIFPNRDMLQSLGFRAPGKANLPRTLG